MADKPQDEINAAHHAPLEDRLFEEHRDDLDGVDISDAAAKEFLLSLHRIMMAFVDLGFELDAPDRKAVYDKQENLPDLRVDVLKLLHPEDTPHETVAPRSPDNEKEQP
ncbi:hypothetical protein [uncultured Roseobacter sp.]|uniref:hypothetical protein n=1 Tax=uncultured Roseobacter sp. TaxID=114847 RepID=UPI0026185B27|nr:hypothetical protein [uncultured Roseobacter sp.]